MRVRTGKPRPIASRQRIFHLRRAPGSVRGCMECSVGTNTDPIPASAKRIAEFRFDFGKHHSVNLCRGCAMQWAEDFAAQLETLIGDDGKSKPIEHSPWCTWQRHHPDFRECECGALNEG